MTDKVLWIVQSNMGSESDIRNLFAALSTAGIPWYGANVIPFSTKLPPIVHDGPVVCYGSVTFIQSCYRAKRWIPGVWGDDANFTYAAWAKNLGNLLINSPDGTIETTIADF